MANHAVITNSFQAKEEEKEFDLESDEPDTPLPLTDTSRVLYMLGDIAAGQAYRFTQWLELVRKRSATYGSSGFPRRPPRISNNTPSRSSSAGESYVYSGCPRPTVESLDISLWERLGKAAMLDIESSSFSWDRLSSLHHTEHSSNTEHSEDEMNKALEVTVNSGGVVFFALFSQDGIDEASPKEAAAVIKFSSSRMTTQSERLGYEFAKWLGVRIPQARVIHNSSPEWLQIKAAGEKARAIYVHGCPLLESPKAFESRESSEKVAAALGRVLMLDLVIRNEDRLPCRQLKWRGNPENLLLADKVTSANMSELEEAFDSAIKRYKPRVFRGIQKERRSTSVDSRLDSHDQGLVSGVSDLSDITESPNHSALGLRSPSSDEIKNPDFFIVAIDSGVPRRPPAGKRANDQANYPKLVELLLNSNGYSSNLLHEITGGRLGSPSSENGDMISIRSTEKIKVIRKFRSGFRAAVRDLQGFHIFLITLHQKLDGSLRSFVTTINKTLSGDCEKDDFPVPESPSQAVGLGSSHYPSSPCKERAISDHQQDCDIDLHRTALRSSMSETKECLEYNSPMSRESWHGKSFKWNGESLRSLRLTTKLRDFHKVAKVDAESNKELEQWNEMLRNEAVKLCQENNFNSGFFEGSDNNICVDAYELKVRLEHILERVALISEAANTERPSAVSSILFIGGALAARSVLTLQHLGITHILCLCSNEIGQSDSQHSDLFEYKNYSITDEEDTNISSIFQEASDFIHGVEQKGGKVLVHCFEGRSRSATLVLAYLMIRKNLTLLEAWTTLKQVHRRAQPNEGFAKALVDLDKALHGKVSMEWNYRKPSMKVCPICGKNAGLSSSSLKLHLQKSHKRLSSGSVDSAMKMEIKKALEALKLSRGGSLSPTKRQSHSVGMDES